jgi:hypothetical protein
MKTPNIQILTATAPALALVLSACAAPPAGSQVSGRWQVIPSELKTFDRDDKTPILLDTQTGETWRQTLDGGAPKWHKFVREP